MVNSRVGSLALGCLRTISLESPAVCFSCYIAQEFPNMPLIENSSIIRPVFPFGIPEEAIEVFLVVLHCPRAFIFSLLGENKALDQRFEGCSERCLDIGTDNHYSFWDPPYFCRFSWSRLDLATFGFLAAQVV